MWTKIGQAFAPPAFEDEDKTRIANLLNVTALTLFVIAVARTVLSCAAPREYFVILLRANAVLVGVLALVVILARAGHVRPASILLTLFQWMATAWLIYQHGGISVSTYSIFAFVILVSGLLLGGQWAVGYAAASVLYGMVILYLESLGIVASASESPMSAFDTVTPSFVTTAVLVYLYRRDITRALRRARDNERAMTEHADQLAQANEQLSHEIAERERLEARLLHAQKMEAIGRLSGGIAHDFNNLLVPILGYVDLAMMASSPGSKLYADLTHVKQAAERAASLTQQILAFSRQQVLDMRLIALNEVIVAFTGMIQHLSGEGIVLDPRLAPELDPVKADRAQIEQILMNLVTNARDAMPEGGTLTIETANVCLDEARVSEYEEALAPGHYVMLAVSDTGHGMDDETKQHIFEPFFTTKERGKGTGLGLATVFGIVRQHQGAIRVYSEPGIGTTLKIYLPRATDTVQADKGAAVDAPPIRGTETVLVVEDEEMVRRLVCQTLEAHGYLVMEAESPNHALELAAGSGDTIDLLLTDVIMPQMNGRELHQRLVALCPGARVLFMSGYTDNVIVHHNLLDSDVEFLQKPFTVQALTDGVKRALRKGGQESGRGGQEDSGPTARGLPT